VRRDPDGGVFVFCSVHEDGHKHGRQSLHLTPGDDQHLVHCFAGCPTTWVLGRVGLSLADLFVSDEDRGAARQAPTADSSPLPDYEAIWAHVLVGSDRVARYLKARGLSGTVPAALRLQLRAQYYRDRVPVAVFDAMVARVQAPNGRLVALHRTYLSGTDDGKAPVDPTRKLTRAAPGSTTGAAIRLADPTETLGVAEGIESALAVLEATGTPMWSTVSADGMKAVVVPETVRRVEIWADYDRWRRTSRGARGGGAPPSRGACGRRAPPGGARYRLARRAGDARRERPRGGPATRPPVGAVGGTPRAHDRGRRGARGARGA
jgi:hypothetical protein